MSEAARHQHILVKNHKKLPITAHNGAHLVWQTRWAGCMMPHPP